MNDTLNNMLQSYGVNPFMRNAVESYIKELEDSLFAARQSVLTEGLLAQDLKSELSDAKEYLTELKQFATEKVNEITELRNSSIDCRICQHYCETNGCEMDDCDKGSDFKKSATLRLWEYQT